MTLQEQIKEHMKDAMRAKEDLKKTTLRGLMSAFTNELVANGGMPTDSISDEDAIKVITREAKRRKDAIQQFTDGGNEAMAADEKAELAILETYLPELMSEDEIRAFAQAKKDDMGISDASEKGKFIGVLMGELKGKADGALVKQVVDSLFA